MLLLQQKIKVLFNFSETSALDPEENSFYIIPSTANFITI